MKNRKGEMRVVLFDAIKAVFNLFKVADYGGGGGIYVNDSIAVGGIFELAISLGEVVRIKAVLC